MEHVLQQQLVQRHIIDNHRLP